MEKRLLELCSAGNTNHSFTGNLLSIVEEANFNSDALKKLLKENSSLNVNTSDEVYASLIAN